MLKEQSSNKLHLFLVYAVLALASLIAYEPVHRNKFINYDDNDYVAENPYVRSGITRESVIWAFTTRHASNWHPLTWLSHMLDCQFFGTNPLWHHLMNLLFHVANTLLLFWVLKRMTGALWPSAFVAAVFALHPLHVESVAWAAERKDVLSGFFWMLTIAAYVRYAERPGIARYLLVFSALCLGLMAKPMLVTLPFVLLLLDYWPLGRFQGRHAATIYRLIGEKAPLFALAAVSSVVTYIAQRGAGAVLLGQKLPLKLRAANAAVSYVSYIGKMIYPSRLAALYPHQASRLPLTQPIVCLVILIIVSAGIIYAARRARFLAVGWLWYLGTLVPVIGLIQVGVQAMADRYTYLPSIGIFIIVAWGAAGLLAGWRYRKIVLAISASIVLAALLLCTRMQVRHWQNSFTLFGHTLEVTERNYIMQNNYGNLLYQNGHPAEAAAHFEEALRINPKHTGALNNLGVISYSQGRIGWAIAHWTKAEKLKPNSADVLNNLAWVKATQENPNYRNPDEAVQLALRACKLTGYAKPRFLDTLAAACAAAGDFAEAAETARRAEKLAEAAGEKKLAGEIRDRLHLYQAGRAYYQK